MKKYDLIIVGDGIIGKLTAYHLSKDNKIKIAIIGSNLNNASKAAGAMIAVYGELEADNELEEHQKLILNLSEESSEKWYLLANKINKKIITADQTIVYLKNNPNQLEKKCFKKIKNYGKPSNNLNLIDKNFKTLLLENEFSINPKTLFDEIDKRLKKNKNLDIYFDEAIFKKNNNYIKLKNQNKIIEGKKILIAAGSSSSKILNNSNVVPIFHGVGTAIEFYSKELVGLIEKRTVYRTPNRGGSNCGVHLVPRGDVGHYYLGAGNYLNQGEESYSRMATVKYLIEALTNEISNHSIMHKAKMELVTGNRPISFDGKPLLGNIKKNKDVFIASGFNRVGLTLSPVIVAEIINWVNDKNLNSRFSEWQPDRDLISYGNIDFAIDQYCEYYIANLIEHKIIKNKEIKKYQLILSKEVIKKHKLLQKKFKLSKNFGFNPEILSLF